MYGYGHKKHHKKHSSSSSSSSSSSDDEPWKKEQKRQKKLMKKMKKHGGQLPPGMAGGYPGAYPAGGAPRPHAQPGYAPPPGSYPAQGGVGYPQQPQPGYPGYPAQGAGAPQPGAPAFVAPPPGQPQMYPQGQPQAQYPGQQPGYPAQAPGYPPQGQQPYPGAGPGYPTAGFDQNAPGYPAQPGYPGAQQGTHPGYPGAQQGSQPGYPGAQQGSQPGYPGAQQGSQPGYPGAAGAPGQVPPAAAYQPPAQPASAPAQHAHSGGGSAPQDPAGVNRVVDDLQKMKLAMAANSTGTAEKVFGTITPAPHFNCEKDTEVIRKAMKGAGTDEKAIINIIGNRSNLQRQQIKQMFKTMYGKDIIKDLKSELRGDLEEMTLALFMPTTYYDAWSLHKAMQGAGTKESVLIEILCTRTNAEIREIVNTYRQQFGQDLEKDVKKETSGHFERLLVSALQGNRSELTTDQLMRVTQQGARSVVDGSQAQADAQALYKAGEGKVGTDESTFLRIFSTRNFYQLRATFEEYQKIKGHTIIKAIEKEMSGDLERGFKAVAKSVMNRPEYFADKLRKAMKGAGTDESTLIRVIVSRSEIDLGNIKDEYQRKHGKPLAQAVKSETSGDFERLLLAIIK